MTKKQYVIYPIIFLFTLFTEYLTPCVTSGNDLILEGIDYLEIDYPITVDTEMYDHSMIDLERGGYLLYVTGYNQSRLNIKDGSIKLNENLEALKHNFLFRRYFKKLERQKQKELKKQQ